MFYLRRRDAQARRGCWRPRRSRRSRPGSAPWSRGTSEAPARVQYVGGVLSRIVACRISTGRHLGMLTAEGGVCTSLLSCTTSWSVALNDSACDAVDASCCCTSCKEILSYSTPGYPWTPVTVPPGPERISVGVPRRRR